MSGNKPFDRNGIIVFITDEKEESIKVILGKLGTSPDCVKIITDDMEWNDLSLSAKHEARLHAELCIGFRLQSGSLESALSGKVLADLINSRKDLQLIKSTLPEPCPYYIKRNLLTRNIISEEVFKASHEDVFLFQGISRTELSAMVKVKLTANSSEQLNRVTSKFIVLDYPFHFTKICQLSNGPVHLVRKEVDGKWMWIKSEGSIKNIQIHVLKREAQMNVNEDILLQQMSKRCFEENIPVCISDSPGMGKSFLLAQIGRRLKKKFPGRVVAFIALPELIKELNKMDIKGDLKAAIKICLVKLVSKNHLGELFLKNKLDLDNDLWIELLLDGFDEVDYSEQAFSHEVLMAIKSFKSVRLWVTSRPHLLEGLEQTLSVLGYNMEPFSVQNQIEFLTRFWGERLEMPKEDFVPFASACLQVLNKSMKSDDVDIAGIPLQCLMIAEIFQDEAKENGGLSNPTTSTESFTFIDLYDLLIKKKIELYFKKPGSANKWTEAEIIDIHKRLSLNLLFPDYNDNLQPNSEQENKYSEEILNIGLLEGSSTSVTPRFIHRTVAEYLAAAYAVDVLRRQSFLSEAFTNLLYDQLLANKSFEYFEYSSKFLYPAICHFFNYLLKPSGDNVRLPKSKQLSEFSIAQEIILTSVTQDFINIFTLFNNTQVVKEFGRFIFNEKMLHTSVTCANLDLIKLVFAHFEKHRQLTQKTQENVFRRAIEGKNFTIIEFLLKEKDCEGLLKTGDSKGYMSTLLALCLSHTQKINNWGIKKRIEIIRILLNLNKINARDLMDLAFGCKPHVELIIELINLGADVCKKDFRRKTILHESCEWATAKEFEKLIKHIQIGNLRRLCSIKDYSKSTLLDTIVKHIDPTTTTLKRFKKAKVDFNNPRYVLATATKYGRSRETLRNLVKFGADVNWKGARGECLLHIAANYGNMEGIQYYMDELGFDVNILDSNRMTPLDYSIIDFDYIEEDMYYQNNDSKTNHVLRERNGLSNIGDLCIQSNLNINYQELKSMIQEMLKEVESDKAKYLSDIFANKEQHEIKSLLITVWSKVVGNNSLLEWVVRINKCGKSSVYIIKHLVKNGADVMECDENGRNFLHYLLNIEEWDDGFTNITNSSFHNICKYLVDNSHTDLLNMKENEENITPLHLAAKHLELEVKTLKMLKKAEVPFDQIDKNGYNLLVYAVKGRRSGEMIKNLSKFGVDWKCRDLKGWNLLHHSADNMHMLELKCFLKLGLSPNDTDNEGHTPLTTYLAKTDIRPPILEIIELLCEPEANLSRTDNNGETATFQTVKTLMYLIDKGDIYSNNRTYVHNWILKRKIVLPGDFHELVDCLIQKKMSSLLEIEGLEDNCTSLHLAINRIEVSEATFVLLDSAGINFNSKDNKGSSLLTYAIRGNRSLNQIDRLIRFGANIFHLDNNRSSLIHSAAQDGTAEALGFLIKKAKIKIKEDNCGRKHVGQYQNGIDLNSQDNNGNTPLHCAMLAKDINGIEKKVLLLLEEMVDSSIKNNNGLCPFDILKQRSDINEDTKSKIGVSLNP